MRANSSIPSRHPPGFTLIEVLGAVFLTTLVLALTTSFYINLSRASERATEIMRDNLHAAAIIERIARDVQGAAMLIKEDEVDPLSHPWMFLATGNAGGVGADRMKFISRSQTPRVTAYHASDLAVVAYFTQPGPHGYRLYRWVAPSMPSDFDPDFPDAGDEHSLLLAERLGSFSLRFLDAEGEWLEEWDSSQLLQSSDLPIAVEVDLSLLPEDAAVDEIELGGFDETDVLHYTRKIVVPFRPLDLEAALHLDDEEDGQGGVLGGDGDADGEGSSGADGDKLACARQKLAELCSTGGDNPAAQTLCSMSGQIEQNPSIVTALDLSAYGCE